MDTPDRWSIDELRWPSTRVRTRNTSVGQMKISALQSIITNTVVIKWSSWMWLYSIQTRFIGERGYFRTITRHKYSKTLTGLNHNLPVRAKTAPTMQFDGDNCVMYPNYSISKRVSPVPSSRVGARLPTTVFSFFFFCLTADKPKSEFSYSSDSFAICIK